MFRPSRAVLALSLVVAFALAPVPALAQATSPYVRTVIVSPTPGSATASGQTLLQALASISGASSTNRWLVKVEPGVYDVGTSYLQMKAWVDLEGSGIERTVIQGTGQPNETFQFTEGVLKGAASTEVRDLTVLCTTTAANPSCITIANWNVSPRYTRVKATSTSAEGVHWGFRNTDASPLLDQVEVLVANGTINYGVVNAGFSGSRATIQRSNLKVQNGSFSNDGILNTDIASVAVSDTTILARGGSESAGIRGLFMAAGALPMYLQRVDIQSDNAANISYGIVDGLYNVVLESSSVDARGTGGKAISMPFVTVTVNHSKLAASGVLVEATSVNLGSTWVRYGGTITGFQTERCAFVWDNGYNTYVNTCP